MGIAQHRGKSIPKPPELGARIKARGYLVRYKPDIPDVMPTAICWKRRREPVEGVFFGVRNLSIGWLFPVPPEEGGYHVCRRVGGMRVYAIAINRRAVRYVLPRDVEEGA